MKKEGIIYLAEKLADGSVKIFNTCYVKVNGKWEKTTYNKRLVIEVLINSGLASPEITEKDLTADLLRKAEKLGVCNVIDFTDLVKGTKSLEDMNVISRETKEALNKNFEALQNDKNLEEDILKEEDEELDLEDEDFDNEDTAKFNFDDDDFEYEEADKKIRKRTRVLAGLGAAAIGVTAVAAGYSNKDAKTKEVAHIDNNFNEKEIEETSKELDLLVDAANKNTNIEDLFNEYSNLNSVQKDFVISTMNFIKSFHDMTRRSGNFRIEEIDKDRYLDMTFNEAMALNLILNEYTEAEINEIFGDYHLDNVVLIDYFNSAWQKLTLYYINAKEPSSVHNLIKNEDARNYFKSIENAVLAFNSNPTKENANNIHRAAYYNYVMPGINPKYKVFNFDTDENKAVAYLALAPLDGFISRASSNEDKIHNYLIASTNDAEEKKDCLGNENYLKNGMKFLPLKNNDLAIDKSLREYNSKNNTGNTILDYINRLNLGEGIKRKADKLELMIENSSKLYNKKYLNMVNGKPLTMDDIVDYAAKELEKIPGYVGTQREVVCYLKTVRRGYFEKEKVNDYVYSKEKKTKVVEKVTPKENHPCDKPGKTPEVIPVPKEKDDITCVWETTECIEKDPSLTKVEEKVIEETKDVKRETEVVTSTTKENWTEKVNKKDLSKEEIKEVEKQENNINLDNLLNNIDLDARKELNSYLNSDSFDLSEEAKAYLNKYNIDVTGMTLIEKVVMLKSLNDGTIDNIKYNDLNILETKGSMLNKYLNSLSGEERKILEARYGSNYEAVVREKYSNAWDDSIKKAWSKTVENIKDGEDLEIAKEMLKNKDKKEEETLKKPEENNQEEKENEGEKAGNEITPNIPAPKDPETDYVEPAYPEDELVDDAKTKEEDSKEKPTEEVDKSHEIKPNEKEETKPEKEDNEIKPNENNEVTPKNGDNEIKPNDNGNSHDEIEPALPEDELIDDVIRDVTNEFTDDSYNLNISDETANQIIEEIMSSDSYDMGSNVKTKTK